MVDYVTPGRRRLLLRAAGRAPTLRLVRAGLCPPSRAQASSQEVAQVAEDPADVVLDAEVGEAQRVMPRRSSAASLMRSRSMAAGGDVVRAAVELDREVVLGPEAVDLPEVDVDVASAASGISGCWASSRSKARSSSDLLLVGAPVGGQDGCRAWPSRVAARGGPAPASTVARPSRASGRSSRFCTATVTRRSQLRRLLAASELDRACGAPSCTLRSPWVRTSSGCGSRLGAMDRQAVARAARRVPGSVTSISWRLMARSPKPRLRVRWLRNARGPNAQQAATRWALVGQARGGRPRRRCGGRGAASPSSSRSHDLRAGVNPSSQQLLARHHAHVAEPRAGPALGSR